VSSALFSRILCLTVFSIAIAGDLTIKITLQQPSLLALNIIFNGIAKSTKSMNDDESVKNCA